MNYGPYQMGDGRQSESSKHHYYGRNTMAGGDKLYEFQDPAKTAGQPGEVLSTELPIIKLHQSACRNALRNDQTREVVVERSLLHQPQLENPPPARHLDHPNLMRKNGHRCFSQPFFPAMPRVIREDSRYETRSTTAMRSWQTMSLEEKPVQGPFTDLKLEPRVEYASKTDKTRQLKYEDGSREGNTSLITTEQPMTRTDQNGGEGGSFAPAQQPKNEPFILESDYLPQSYGNKESPVQLSSTKFVETTFDSQEQSKPIFVSSRIDAGSMRDVSQVSGRMAHQKHLAERNGEFEDHAERLVGGFMYTEMQARDEIEKNRFLQTQVDIGKKQTAHLLTQNAAYREEIQRLTQLANATRQTSNAFAVHIEDLVEVYNAQNQKLAESAEIHSQTERSLNEKLDTLKATLETATKAYHMSNEDLASLREEALLYQDMLTKTKAMSEASMRNPGKDRCDDTRGTIQQKPAYAREADRPDCELGFPRSHEYELSCLQGAIQRQRQEIFKQQGNTFNIYHELAVLQMTIRRNLGVNALRRLRQYALEDLVEIASMPREEIDDVYREHLQAMANSDDEVDMLADGKSRFQKFTQNIIDESSDHCRQRRVPRKDRWQLFENIHSAGDSDSHLACSHDPGLLMASKVHEADIMVHANCSEIFLSDEIGGVSCEQGECSDHERHNEESNNEIEDEDMTECEIDNDPDS